MKAVLSLLVLGVAAAVAQDAAPNPPLGFQPNIVFILTDDQDRVLGQADEYTRMGSLDAMPATKEHLVQGGAFFDNFFVATSICCPSRTESFTGRYFHNVRAAKGQKACMHALAFQNVFNTSASMFGLMQAAGYQTGVFGKVTNDQGSAYWSPSKESTWMTEGMTHINSPIRYNDYDCSEYFVKYPNGTKHVEKLDASNPKYGTTYQTAQIGNRTLEWLDTLQASGSKQPFFAYIGPHAPHYPAEPAPWYQHAYDDTLTAPRLPNYNVSSPNKTQHIRQNPPLSEDAKCWEDQHMRDRWASLRSVDDLVDAVVQKLTDMGELDRTFIFYSSDHGYKLGSWRLGTSKQHPYDTDLRIPMLVRGPKVAGGSSSPIVAGNIDVTPTFLELAGVEKPSFIDGKSFAHTLVPDAFSSDEVKARASAWREQYLSEYESVGTYYNDHSDIWHSNTSGPSGTWECSDSGAGPRSPPGDSGKCVEEEGVGTGQCYFVDSTHSNSWRSLRTITSDTNTVYIEYDSTWTWQNIEFFELYDLNADPYQLNNIYNSTSPSMQSQLHAEIERAYGCSGPTCA